METITIKGSLTTFKIHTNENEVMFTVMKAEGI